MTAEDVTALQEAITIAQAVYSDQEATQELVENTITSINDATLAYMLAGQPGTMETAIVDEYNLLKEEAQALLTNTKVSEDGTDVSSLEFWAPASAHLQLTDGISAADSVVLIPEVVYDDAVLAITTLSAEMDTFELVRTKGIDTTAELASAKAVLSNIITGIEADKVAVSVDGSDIFTNSEWTTPEELAILTAGVTAAQLVLDNPAATVKEVTDATNALANIHVAYGDAKQWGTKLSEIISLELVLPESYDPRVVQGTTPEEYVSGMYQKIKWSDGTNTVRNVETTDISGVDFNILGLQTITIEFNGFIVTMEVTVVAVNKVATNITTVSGIKNTFIGEELNLENATITVEYSDASTEDIVVTADMVTGFDSSVAVASQVLTITYEGLTIQHIIAIEEKSTPATPIAIEPVTSLKTEYYIGESFEATDFTVIYSDDSREVITIGEDAVTGFDTSEEKTGLSVTITHNGISYVYSINVIEDTVYQFVDVADYSMVSGDDFFEQGFTIKTEMSSGKIIDVPLTEDIIVDVIPNDIAGTHRIGMSYKGMTQLLKLNVSRKYVDSTIDTITAKTVSYIRPGHGPGSNAPLFLIEYTDGNKEFAHGTGVELWDLTLHGGVQEGFVAVTYLSSLIDEPIKAYAIIIPEGVDIPGQPNITITAPLAKTEYQIGDEPSLGEYITATDGTYTANIPTNHPLVYVDGFDSSETGMYYTDIRLGLSSAVTYDYTVVSGETPVEPMLKWVTEPKTEYTPNSEMADEKLKVVNSDGTETTVLLSQCEITGFDTKTEGVKTVTIKFNGMSIQYEIKVEKSDDIEDVTPVSMTATELTTQYNVGAAFDNKGTVTVTNDDKSTITLAVKDCKVTGFDSSKEGNIEVTIAYGELTHKFTVKIVKPVTPPSTGGGGGGGGGGSVTPKPPVTPPTTTVPTSPTESNKSSKVETITKEILAKISSFTLPAQALQGMDTTNLTVADGKAAQAISVAGKTIDFKDIKGHWAADAIDSAVKKGLLNGVSGTDFAPKAPLTLEQALVGINNAMMLNNMISMKMDRSDVEQAMSTQLANPTWSTFAVAQTLANTDKATLDKVAANPAALKANITRAELAEMLFKVLGTTLTVDASNAEDFCKATGFMVGDANGNFSGDRALSRAELSSVLLRVDAKLAAI